MEDCLFHSPTLWCRTLAPQEHEFLEAAASLERTVWGIVGQDAKVFADRVTHGFVVAAFQNGDLVGTLSCLRRRFEPVLRARVESGNPYATWDGITGQGRFVTAEPEGDALFCVAVTSSNATARPEPTIPDGSHPALLLARDLSEGRDALDPMVGRIARELAEACAPIHVPRDDVMRFHARPKGLGLLGGARIVSVLCNGRPNDLPAMGYNVVMAYPPLPASFPKRVVLDQGVSIGEALVLATAALASRIGVRLVVPYSRPAGFRRALVEALCTFVVAPTCPDPLVRVVWEYLKDSEAVSEYSKFA